MRDVAEIFSCIFSIYWFLKIYESQCLYVFLVFSFQMGLTQVQIHMYFFRNLKCIKSWNLHLFSVFFLGTTKCICVFCYFFFFFFFTFWKLQYFRMCVCVCIYMSFFTFWRSQCFSRLFVSFFPEIWKLKSYNRHF